MIHSKGKHLEFGKGDIGIHMGTSTEGGILLFRNLDRPSPIGKVLNGRRRKEVEILDSDVLMSFSNAESIDALMTCLLIVKRTIQSASMERTADI